MDDATVVKPLDTVEAVTGVTVASHVSVKPSVFTKNEADDSVTVPAAATAPTSDGDCASTWTVPDETSKFGSVTV